MCPCFMFFRNWYYMLGLWPCDGRRWWRRRWFRWKCLVNVVFLTRAQNTWSRKKMWHSRVTAKYCSNGWGFCPCWSHANKTLPVSPHTLPPFENFEGGRQAVTPPPFQLFFFLYILINQHCWHLSALFDKYTGSAITPVDWAELMHQSQEPQPDVWLHQCYWMDFLKVYI